MLVEVPITGPIASASHYILDLTVMSQVARVLGKPEDAERYRSMAEALQPALHRAFYNNSAAPGVYLDGQQTVTVLPLAVGATPLNLTSTVARHLQQQILDARQSHLSTGAVGTRFLLPVLQSLGLMDTALALCSQTTEPSWGYWLANGATSCWEDWSGKADPTHPPPPSHNHIFLGSSGAFLFEGLLGLQQAVSRTDAFTPSGAGFAVSVVRPPVLAYLGSASGQFNSTRGLIAVSWAAAEQV